MASDRSVFLVASKTSQQSRKVIEILGQNKDGLTSLQINNLLGDRMRRGLLLRLQNQGKIRQKKAILAGGKIGIVYVLNAVGNAERS